MDLPHSLTANCSIASAMLHDSVQRSGADTQKGPFLKEMYSYAHFLSISFPTFVTLPQYCGAYGLYWREDRIFSPAIQKKYHHKPALYLVINHS